MPSAAHRRSDREIHRDMLFLVISEPRPEPPSSVTAQRKKFWDWVAPLQASGEVRSIHAKVGRGAVALFDVPSNEGLHRRLNEWADIIPAHFQVHALIDPDAAKAYLNNN
jgi:muconolactone delta-isomerase